MSTERIAAALERIADVMEADREMMLRARREMAEQVSPADCPHPPEHRTRTTQGAQITLGCGLCGADMTRRRSA